MAVFWLQIAHIPRRWLALLALLGLAGALLLFFAVPGVFTIDENNHIASVIGLRHGDFALPGTTGLTPSRELFWFDPNGGIGNFSTPVRSIVPPLYSLIALPFSYFGLRGLIALNTVAFLLAIATVFRLTARLATRPVTPWVATIIFMVGAYNIEYALGIWPHMLSVAFCALAVDFLSAGHTASTVRRACLAGVFAGIAAGIRYQNIVFAGLLGCSILFWNERRARRLIAFVSGVGLPLGISAVVNRLRLGWWNPINKGAAYTSMPSAGKETAFEAARVFWAKVIDFSFHPPLAGSSALSHPDEFGAFIAFGAAKKAWLQSCPWVLIALAVLASAWIWNVWEPRLRRELRFFGIVVAGTLAFFCAAGFARHDGVSFNQRYFLEIVPLAAIATALVFEIASFSLRAWIGGALLGGGLAATTWLGEAGSGFRSLVLLKLPLVIGFASLASFIVFSRKRTSPHLMSAVVACCSAWAITVHLTDDLPASRRYRAYTRAQYELFAAVIPNQSALITQRVTRDSTGPLLLNRDVVILDASADEGVSLPTLVAELHQHKRQIFVDTAQFPASLFDSIRESKEVAVIVPGQDPIVELRWTIPSN